MLFNLPTVSDNFIEPSKQPSGQIVRCHRYGSDKGRLGPESFGDVGLHKGGMCNFNYWILFNVT